MPKAQKSRSSGPWNLPARSDPVMRTSTLSYLEFAGLAHSGLFVSGRDHRNVKLLGLPWPAPQLRLVGSAGLNVLSALASRRAAHHPTHVFDKASLTGGFHAQNRTNQTSLVGRSREYPKTRRIPAMGTNLLPLPSSNSAMCNPLL